MKVPALLPEHLLRIEAGAEGRMVGVADAAFPILMAFGLGVARVG
jgi:hypothetical protein